MQIFSNKQHKKNNIFDVNIYYVLMAIIVISALIVMFRIQIPNNNKLMTLIGLGYMFVACIFLNDNTDINIEILGIDIEEREDVLTDYLNLMIESLKKANFYMSSITTLDNYSCVDFKIYLKKLNCIYLYLKRINPPKQYNEYHEDIILQLEFFLMKMDNNHSCFEDK